MTIVNHKKSLINLVNIVLYRPNFRTYIQRSGGYIFLVNSKKYMEENMYFSANHYFHLFFRKFVSRPAIWAPLHMRDRFTFHQKHHTSVPNRFFYTIFFTLVLVPFNGALHASVYAHCVIIRINTVGILLMWNMYTSTLQFNLTKVIFDLW